MSIRRIYLDGYTRVSDIQNLAEMIQIVEKLKDQMPDGYRPIDVEIDCDDEGDVLVYVEEPRTPSQVLEEKLTIERGRLKYYVRAYEDASKELPLISEVIVSLETQLKELQD